MKVNQDTPVRPTLSSFWLQRSGQQESHKVVVGSWFRSCPNRHAFECTFHYVWCSFSRPRTVTKSVWVLELLVTTVCSTVTRFWHSSDLLAASFELLEHIGVMTAETHDFPCRMLNVSFFLIIVNMLISWNHCRCICSVFLFAVISCFRMVVDCMVSLSQNRCLFLRWLTVCVLTEDSGWKTKMES